MASSSSSPARSAAMALGMVLILAACGLAAAQLPLDHFKAYHFRHRVPNFMANICGQTISRFTTNRLTDCERVSTNSSYRADCDYSGGLMKRYWHSSPDCRSPSPDKTELTVTKKCFFDGEDTDLAQTINCGTDQWLTYENLKYLRFYQGEGNITISKTCTEGKDCYGPRRVSFENSLDCSGPSSSLLAYNINTPVKPGLCYYEGNFVNVRFTCGPEGATLYKYNNGCQDVQPFQTNYFKTGVCFQDGQKGSFKYEC